jgi:hypothetical protein
MVSRPPFIGGGRAYTPRGELGDERGNARTRIHRRWRGDHNWYGVIELGAVFEWRGNERERGTFRG